MVFQIPVRIPCFRMVNSDKWGDRVKTLEERKQHNDQCFVEGVADIDAKASYTPDWGVPVPSVNPLNDAISMTGGDNAVFYERAGLLSAQEVENLMARMRPPLHWLVAQDAPSKILALTIQLKKEDGDIYLWRQRIVEIRGRGSE